MAVTLGIPRIRVDSADLTGRPEASGLIDRFGRVATDLRVSLTDLCNLRCTYCMPEDGVDPTPRDRILTTEELLRLVRIAVEQLGVRKVRFTGGEPLLRRDLVDIVAATARLDPRPEIALTTNAIGLGVRAQALADAGLDRANVSLDTLHEDTFAQMARRPFLTRTLDGIQALQDAGVRPIKINAVLLRGVNDHEAADLLAWSLDRGLELRFIEQMPLGAARDWQRADVVTAADTRALLSERFRLEPVQQDRAGAPAERWWVKNPDGDTLGSVGIIASVTEPFCGDCTRTRLTADGGVRNCLFSHSETPLRDALRTGASDDDLATLWRGAMWQKAAGHGIDDPSFLQPARPMSAIGG